MMLCSVKEQLAPVHAPFIAFSYPVPRYQPLSYVLLHILSALPNRNVSPKSTPVFAGVCRPRLQPAAHGYMAIQARLNEKEKYVV